MKPCDASTPSPGRFFHPGGVEMPGRFLTAHDAKTASFDSYLFPPSQANLYYHVMSGYLRKDQYFLRGGIFEEKRWVGERFYFRWVTCYTL